MCFHTITWIFLTLSIFFIILAFYADAVFSNFWRILDCWGRMDVVGIAITPGVSLLFHIVYNWIVYPLTLTCCFVCLKWLCMSTGQMIKHNCCHSNMNVQSEAGMGVEIISACALCMIGEIQFSMKSAYSNSFFVGGFHPQTRLWLWKLSFSGGRLM